MITDCSQPEEYALGKKAVFSLLEASFLGGERVLEGVESWDNLLHYLDTLYSKCLHGIEDYRCSVDQIG
jgi:hypothetical protein